MNQRSTACRHYGKMDRKGEESCKKFAKSKKYEKIRFCSKMLSNVRFSANQYIEV